MILKIAEKYDVSTKQSTYNIKKQIIHKMRRLLKTNVTLGFSNDLIKQDFLVLFEGCRLEAYYEKTGLSIKTAPNTQSNVAVGYGFNMSRPEAKVEWKNVLPISLYEQIKQGIKTIEHAQALALLRNSVQMREHELKRIFDTSWHYLPDNIKIALESAYYNVPALFAYNSMLRQYVFNYVETGHNLELFRIGRLLLSYRHKNLHASLHVRRKLESFLLCGEDDLDEIVEKLKGCDYMTELNYMISA